MDTKGLKKEDFNDFLQGQPVDLTNCDREPIHIPGSIQPFGFLICVNETNFEITHVSENIKEFTNLDHRQIIGERLEKIIPEEELLKIKKILKIKTNHIGFLEISVGSKPFNTYLHRYDNLLWLEFQPEQKDNLEYTNYSMLLNTFKDFKSSATIREFCWDAASKVREVTGFDRVVIYRFKEDQSGEVIAEDKRKDLQSWLGYHFPATDIPLQARIMYLKNWIRLIPDSYYKPVKVFPLINKHTGLPPDMTHSVLRSVSPIHLEYLHNIGVNASMSISLIKENRLWGLVACHHQSSKLLNYNLRALCEIIGHSFSSYLTEKEEKEESKHLLFIRSYQSKIIQHLSARSEFIEVVQNVLPDLMEMFNSGGVAFCFENTIYFHGNTPTEEQTRELLSWIRNNNKDEIFHTNSYRKLNAENKIQEYASGILAIKISAESHDHIILFRPERNQTITWAGNPEKTVTLTEGEVRLSPRKSFESWNQDVEATSWPWKRLEIEAAYEIKHLFMDVLLRILNELRTRAENLKKMNIELEKSNQELDSFTYIASHDLKAPINNLEVLINTLVADLGNKGDDTSQLLELTAISLERLKKTVNSLNETLSTDNDKNNQVEEISFQEIFDLIKYDLQNQIVMSDATIRTDFTKAPFIYLHPSNLRSVIYNIFSNALKYRNPERRLEIVIYTEMIGKDYLLLSVRDNGLGLKESDKDRIFSLFKRVHDHVEGSGIGLSLVKKIVDANGGTIELESEVGNGSEFKIYFKCNDPVSNL